MICTHCHVDKPLEQFVKHRETISGRTQPCKICANTRYVAYMDKDREAFNAHARKRSEKRRRQAGYTPQINTLDRLHELPSGRLGMQCIACLRDVDLEGFYLDKRSLTGHMQPCKQCVGVRQKAIRAHISVEKRVQDNKKRNIGRATRPQNRRRENIIRRARKRSLPAMFTMEERKFMLAYWGYACAICGNQEGFEWTIADDHVIPLADPHCPGTVALNMLPLCHGVGGCNNTKSNKNLHIWLIAHYGKRKTIMIEKKITIYFELVRQRSQCRTS